MKRARRLVTGNREVEKSTSREAQPFDSSTPRLLDWVLPFRFLRHAVKRARRLVTGSREVEKSTSREAQPLDSSTPRLLDWVLPFRFLRHAVKRARWIVRKVWQVWEALE
jgi:hypothetical protein